jgi:hypothetical protein
MAETVQIQCINKTPRQDPHNSIQNVGGIHNGTRWRMTLAEAIVAIETGVYKFYASAQGKSVWVHVALHLGNKYLKTEPDQLYPNNLLALQECPK